jgi:glycosyltransferase involved in cell wall biosynthesis
MRSGHNPFWKEGLIPIISQVELDEIVTGFRPDVLHSHDATTLGLQLMRLGHRQDLPKVATVHYVPRFAARYIGKNGDPQAAVESLVWGYSTWLLNRFDRVTFPTKTHRQYFLKNGLRSPSTVISNGIDLKRYQPQNGQLEDVALRYRLPDGPRVLFVGRLAKDKEIDILIRAMNLLDQQPPVNLLLVGKGDDRPRLEALVDELDLRDCVHFLGFVPEQDLPALYRASDIFAIASTCEVQSLPTLQAVATGLPVVAANAMALPELVQDGGNGYLVPPGDPQAISNAVACILANQSKAQRMGVISMSIAQQHAQEYTFQAYEDLYQKTVKRMIQPVSGIRSWI